MEARMGHPAFVVPGAMKALQALSKSADDAGLPKELLELVHLRASQINGCSVCVGMHAGALQNGGDSMEKVFTVAAWRDAPYFTDAERAALALTEAVTRLADQAEPVSDELWQEASKHFGEKELGALLISISAINVWNRLNAATKQVAGAAW
ncbi:alkyl hydroperoxide reductase AhpD [Lentzea sp. NBRC 105346]|uniref:carboxymuconolactone decarboxylase family protein n=1 Tax=Lentzea sp. NBRC 105346 TaxID=3032205 RepID=UPI002552EA47|nr:carboxymuconolactone decarboxylase family protein [Lentzea sp. NBRC 105346]GLZ30570.1 alkyl hydroperoxide reductase AhpD [Lentzea sp. NBRC 105346]